MIWLICDLPTRAGNGTGTAAEVITARPAGLAFARGAGPVIMPKAPDGGRDGVRRPGRACYGPGRQPSTLKANA